MLTSTALKIKRELRKHGATGQQAETYINLLGQFEEQSRDSIESVNAHHILPRNCGWWKKYAKSKWNRVRVDWALHLALHAYLVSVFPESTKFVLAFRRTASHVVTKSPKMLRNKNRIIEEYEKGKSASKLAKELHTDAGTILDYLKYWGIHTRLHGEAQRTRRIYPYKERVIEWYRNGRSPMWISQRIPVSHTVVIQYLKEWGIRTRTMTERGEAYSKPAGKKNQIIRWYKEGKPSSWIGKRLGIGGHGTINNWLRKWGIRPRTAGELQTFPEKQKYKRRIIHWYRSGESCPQIAERIRVGKHLISRWLESYGIRRRPSLTAQRLRRSREAT